MPIQFECPNCKTSYEVADDLGGKFIMCRGCQKRGPVRAPGGKAGSGSLAAAAAKPPTRRNFLAIGGLSLASVVAIVSGAVLARRPWRAWDNSTERGFGPRGPRGPRPEGDDKDRKDRKDRKDDKEKKTTT